VATTKRTQRPERAALRRGPVRGGLLADDTHVVGRLEVGDPVVEETDTVRLAKAIQFVEPDRPLAQPLAEVLEEELEPASLKEARPSGSCKEQAARFRCPPGHAQNCQGNKTDSPTTPVCELIPRFGLSVFAFEMCWNR
jgi:hypothetical protein